MANHHDSPSERKLAAILFADIQGYTALMQKDEAHSSVLLRRFQNELTREVNAQNGRIVNFYGDGALCIFNNPLDAMQCAMAVQTAFQTEPIVPVRVGIHMGTVVLEGGKAYGDSINIASRIESLAIPGSILLSRRVRDELKNRPNLRMQTLGSFDFKNVEDPIEAFVLTNPGFVVPARGDIKGKLQIQSVKVNTMRLALAVTALILIAVIAFLIINRLGLNDDPSPVDTSSTLQSMAVLPFSNLRDDPDSDFLGLALADEITGDLSYVNEILVRPSSAVRKYHKTAVDAPTAGSDLNVDFILVGTYQREGSVVRMDVELVDVKSNERVWWEEFEEAYQNAFQLQDIISEKVMQGLQVKFTDQESKLRTADISKSPLAYEYYLRALAQPGSHEGNNLAVDLLRKSVVLDSLFAPAWSELGLRIKQLAAFTVGEGHQVEVAEQMLQKALTLNADLLSALGYMVALYVETGRIDQSVETARHVLSINPNSAEIHYFLGYAYRYAGFLEEAQREQKSAQTLDPRNGRYNMGMTYIYLNKLKEALDEFVRFTESPFSLAWQGQIHLRLGNDQRALSLFNRVIELDQEGVGRWVSSMKSYLEGKPENGLITLQELEVNIVDAEQIYNIANLYALLGYQKDCIRNLRKAVSRGFFAYPVFQNDKFLDPVRDDPDFKEVLEEARIKHEAFERRYF